MRADLMIPYGCRNGACGTCKGKILDGDRRLRPAPGVDADRRRKAHRARALLLRASRSPISSSRCARCAAPATSRSGGCRAASSRSTSRRPTSRSCSFKLPANERLQFLAGQYIDFLLKDGQRRSFSLATPPHDDELLELHIRHVPGGFFTDALFTTVQGTRDPALRRAARHVLPARGIGQADHLRRRRHRLRADQGDHRARAASRASSDAADGALLGRAREARSLSARPARRRGRASIRNFTYIPVLSEPQPEDAWPGRTGLRAPGGDRRLPRPVGLPGLRLRRAGDDRRRAARLHARCAACRPTSSSPTASRTRPRPRRADVAPVRMLADWPMLDGKRIVVVLPAYQAAATLEAARGAICRTTSSTTCSWSTTRAPTTRSRWREARHRDDRASATTGLRRQSEDVLHGRARDRRRRRRHGASRLPVRAAPGDADGGDGRLRCLRRRARLAHPRRRALARRHAAWKYVANRALTAVENAAARHASCRSSTPAFAASRAHVLEALPLESNSDDFVFDNEMLAQCIVGGFRIGEISCPARYFEEASSIGFSPLDRLRRRRAARRAAGLLASRSGCRPTDCSPGSDRVQRAEPATVALLALANALWVAAARPLRRRRQRQHGDIAASLSCRIARGPDAGHRLRLRIRRRHRPSATCCTAGSSSSATPQAHALVELSRGVPRATGISEWLLLCVDRAGYDGGLGGPCSSLSRWCRSGTAHAARADVHVQRAFVSTTSVAIERSVPAARMGLDAASRWRSRCGRSRCAYGSSIAQMLLDDEWHALHKLLRARLDERLHALRIRRSQHSADAVLQMDLRDRRAIERQMHAPMLARRHRAPRGARAVACAIVGRVADARCLWTGAARDFAAARLSQPHRASVRAHQPADVRRDRRVLALAAAAIGIDRRGRGLCSSRDIPRRLAASDHAAVHAGAVRVRRLPASLAPALAGTPRREGPSIGQRRRALRDHRAAARRSAGAAARHRLDTCSRPRAARTG